MKKRLLILTADAGFGHRSASNAVAQAFDILHGGEGECCIVNPVLDDSVPFMIRKSQEDYDQNVTQNPGFYSFTYKLSDTPPASMMINATMRVMLNRAMRNLIGQYQPDCILSTFHFYQAALGPILAVQSQKIPLFSVVTDLAEVHQLWFEGSPNILFVPTDRVRQQALESGVPEQKIVLSGIPVRPCIALEKRKKREIRLSLGWDPDLPVLLVVASKRVNREHLQQLLYSINTGGQPFQMAVVTGGDDTLLQSLHQVEWQIPIHLYGYTDNMAAILHASDLLVSKAGGLITSEALACGLPILLTEFLPGQEEGNIRFLCDEHAAMAVSDPASFSRQVHELFKDQMLELGEYAENARRIGKPDAAFVIAETIWQTTNSQGSISSRPTGSIFRSISNGQHRPGVPR